jgi:hypothetical protein
LFFGSLARGRHKTTTKLKEEEEEEEEKNNASFFSFSLALSLSLSLPHSLSLSIHRRRRITEKVGGREIQNGREPEESAFFLSFSVLSRLNLKERKDFHLRHSRGGPGRRRWRDDGGTD